MMDKARFDTETGLQSLTKSHREDRLNEASSLTASVSDCELSSLSYSGKN